MSAVPEEYDGSTPRPAEQGRPGSDDANRLDRLRGMLRARRLGASYDAIAKQYGYADASGARQLIIRALQEDATEAAGVLRTLENERLDIALQALMGIVTDTTKTPEQRVRAADAITRNSARRARLNGLDAPVQVAVGAGSLAELDDALEMLHAVVMGEVVASEPADDDAGPAQLEQAGGTGPEHAAGGVREGAAGGSPGDQ